MYGSSEIRPMGRPSDVTPRDIDFYYLHRVQDVWAAVHACERIHRDGEDRFEAVCGLASGNMSTVFTEEMYESVGAALCSAANPCALCRETGAFAADERE
jgi:hypothetical protein